MGSRYINRWGKIRQIHVPNAIIKNGTITLDSNALSVFLALLQINKNKAVKDYEPFATVKVGQERLMQYTGYSQNVITKAVQGLQDKKFIEPNTHRKRHGEFGTNEYTLCSPEDGTPLTACRSVMYGNQLPYFTFPVCVVTEQTANWSLAKMTGSELRLYISILFLANRHKSNEFDSTSAELRQLSGLVPATFRKALDQLECRGLIWVSPRQKAYNISLCDPYTGQPIHEIDGDDENDPANYFTKGDGGQSKRLNLNTGDPEQVERLIRSRLSEEAVIQGNGDLMIHCPFHSDSTPSCSVSPRKNGCFHCFGCDKSGSLTDLITQLGGVSKGEAIQQTAKVMGINIEFHQPDKNAVVYSYKNSKGKLLKQVLRYPDENGQKVFSQRRPGKGNWIWSVSGFPPMLFNMELLEFADVVCITEGEKDAVTVTALQLDGTRGLVIGTTSGSAESWNANLAKPLRGKRVVLMPDADEPGARFAASVEASLKAEGIEYRVVSFEDVGAKDVTEFMEAGHTAEELAQRIGTDWIEVPSQQPQSEFPLPETAMQQVEIAI